jgi:hypothetical protein
VVRLEFFLSQDSSQPFGGDEETETRLSVPYGPAKPALPSRTRRLRTSSALFDSRILSPNSGAGKSRIWRKPSKPPV